MMKTFQDWWDENDLKSHDVIMRCAIVGLLYLIFGW